MAKLLDNNQIFEVFAKVKADEPLRHCGNVMAIDAEGAKVYAYKMYDEFPWTEMVVIPRQAMVTIIKSK